MFSKSKANSTAGREIERVDDHMLIDRCKEGEIAAFDELIRRYEKRVFSFAYRISGNHDDASDVTQEAFIRVFNSIKTFRGDANFTTWIYQIVKNVYLDSRKKAKSHRLTSLDEYIDLDENSVTRQIEDEGPSPLEIVEQKEREMIVQRAIDALPDYQRIIVSLYHMQHQSYEEIADILQLPIGTVKSRLNRARLALLEKLGAEPELF